jgi:hypothetical protein
MPKVSERQFLLREINNLIFLHAVTKTLHPFESELWNYYEAEIANLLQLQAFIEASRYIKERTPIPKTSALRNILFDLPENSFRQLVRMSKPTFQFLEGKVFNY